MPTPPASNGRQTEAHVRHRRCPRQPVATPSTSTSCWPFSPRSARATSRCGCGVTQTGIAGKIADTLNDIIELNQEMARELERVSLVVGKEGSITQRAHLAGAGGSWAASVDSVNTLIATWSSRPARWPA